MIQGEAEEKNIVRVRQRKTTQQQEEDFQLEWDSIAKRDFERIK